MVNSETFDTSLGKIAYSSLSGQNEEIKSGLSLPEKETNGNCDTIVSYTVQRHQPPEEMDWEVFDAITDEEIAAAIATDPDAEEPSDEVWSRAVIVA